jgi:hypothetical protein
VARLLLGLDVGRLLLRNLGLFVPEAVSVASPTLLVNKKYSARLKENFPLQFKQKFAANKTSPH